MKNIIIFSLLLWMYFGHLHAQEVDVRKIEQTCLNYIEGFYEGDSTKIISSIKPSLYKFGYWKKKNTDIYAEDGHMTFQQAIDYSNNVLRNKQFAEADAPKIVEVLDVSNHIACAKITAWWGIDYVLLSRNNDGWLIEEVLWEGPLEKQSNGLSISYIGNMGVLISNNENVVVIDGFHKKYKPEYAFPSDSTVHSIIKGEYKNYSKPDISLVTHYHKDHFDAEYHRIYLQENPESLVVAPQQVNDLIRESLKSETLKISPVLKQVPYDENEYAAVHQNIRVKAFKCPHINSARHYSVQNIAYLISLNNYSVLHLGDTNWDVAASILEKKELFKLSIDVAILPYWMLLDKNSKERITNLIAPKQIIATHIPPDYSIEEQVKLQKEYPTVRLFTKLNEQLNYK